MLTVEGLCLHRGARPLLTDLSFSIGAGEVLVLRGANGAGKTSLLRVIAGLTHADAGRVLSQGAAKLPMLYVGHSLALKDELTAIENLRAALALDAVLPSVEMQRSALEQVGLGAQRDVLAARLSQGQKRRLGIARMMLSQTSFWLLDEPTNALDADGVKLICAVIDDHIAKGGAALIATHLPLPLAQPTRELQLGTA